MASTNIVITIRTITANPGFSDAELGAAVRKMFATKTAKKPATKPAKTTATKPELLSKEQFREKYPNGDVPAAVVGQVFNIKGRDLPHGLERYNPDPNKPHQYIRVVRAEGAGYVPPGGDVDYSDIEAPATPGGASLELTAPKAPNKQSLTKSRTAIGEAHEVTMELFTGHKDE